MDKLKQIKLNAIVAKILHNTKIKKYGLSRSIFSFISISIPIIITAIMFFSKGSDTESLVSIVSFIVSIGVVLWGIVMLIANIDEKYFSHKIQASKNIDVANEAENILGARDLPQETVQWFTKYSSQIDEKDNEILNGIKEDKKREAYRNALKEFEPGNHEIKCPICGKSPWKYNPGNCQLCGNTMEETNV